MTAGIIDYKYKKEKQGVDLETLFVTALTAFTGGIGIIAVFAVLTGADICQWSKKGMVGTYLLLSVLIWGILLFFFIVPNLVGGSGLWTYQTIFSR